MVQVFFDGLSGRVCYGISQKNWTVAGLFAPWSLALMTKYMYLKEYLEDSGWIGVQGGGGFVDDRFFNFAGKKRVVCNFFTTKPVTKSYPIIYKHGDQQLSGLRLEG